MPTAMEMSLVSLSVNHVPLYISYECCLGRDEAVADNPASSATSPATDSIIDFLMKKCNNYVSLKPDSNKNNIKQTFGVRGSYLTDFVSFLSEFASLL